MEPKYAKRVLRRFKVYDLEWFPGSMLVRVVGCYDGRNYTPYATVDDFLDYELTPENNGLWYYAHFGGGADYQFLHERFIRRGGFTISGCSSGSSAMIVDVSRGRHTWRFIDSYRLLPSPLREIGRDMGMHKGGPTDDMTEDDRRDWYGTVPTEELIPYNEQDCKILWHAINNFENELLELGGQLQMTLAGCSLELFRRKYLKSELPRSQTVNDRARQAYVASRVEVYSRRATDCNYWDINSSFPASMTLDLPGRVKTCSQGRLPDAHEIYLADLEVTIPQNNLLPPLPYRRGGRVFFPTGSWRGQFFNVDVLTLLEAGGRIDRVHDVITFYPFHDCAAFAVDLYDKRAKSEGYQRYLYKILLNSLYGKFGESPFKEKWHVNPDAKTLRRLSPIGIDGKPNVDNMLMPGVWREAVEVRLEHEHVALSAAITAHSRRALYLHMVGRSPAYCDTDGFAIPSNFELPTGKGLGDLKLEKKVAAADFISPKIYRLRMDDGRLVHKAKGFSLGHPCEKECGKCKRCMQQATNFENIMEGREVELTRMARIKENMSRGIITPWERPITKRLRNAFPKRNFQSDGSSVPWTVEEIRERMR